MSTQRSAYPVITLPVYIDTEADMPLGAYGCEILKRMPKSNPQKYWQLSFGGALTSTVQKEESELLELKYILMDEMEKKYPRPKTTDFLAVANHVEVIDELAERVIKRQIRKNY